MKLGAATDFPLAWNLAFPRWDIISDLVPVAGHAPVTACSPEVRTEIVLEAGTAFCNAQHHTFEQLYPLVPRSFEVDLGRLGGVQPFAEIATASVQGLSHKSDSLTAVHYALAQVNVAVAEVGAVHWPADPILRSVASVLFGLTPEDFYLVVDVHLRGRDRKFAEPYYFDNYGDELDLVLPHALDHAGRSALSPELKLWLAELKSVPSHWRDTHSQLIQTFGVLEFTLAQALGALYPDRRIKWDSFVG